MNEPILLISIERLVHFNVLTEEVDWEFHLDGFKGVVDAYNENRLIFLILDNRHIATGNIKALDFFDMLFDIECNIESAIKETVVNDSEDFTIITDSFSYFFEECDYDNLLTELSKQYNIDFADIKTFKQNG